MNIPIINKSKQKLLYTALMAILYSSGSSLPILAQEAEADDKKNEGVITVTARRREENPQETPISLSAFSSDDLQERALSELSEVTNFIPNVTNTTSVRGGNSSVFRIRGAGLDDTVATNEPSVGLYLDGVYIGRTAGAALDLLEIERVEVLRGPQGTLFGRNTIGGAINVITADPAHDLSGFVEGIAGSRDRYDIKASINVPVVDDVFAMRIAFVHNQEDGFVKSLDDGGTFGDKDRNAVRLSALFTPNEDFRLRISADYTKDEGEADPGAMVAILPTSFIPAAFVVEENNEFTHAGFRPGLHAKVSGIAADWTWDINDSMSIRSITSSRDMEHRSGVDFDGTPFNIFDQLGDTTQEQFSQEFHLLGETDNLSYMIGAFYFDEEIDETWFYPLPGAGFMLAEQNLSDNSSSGAFFNIAYAISDNLNLGFGVRNTKEDKKITYNHTLQFPGPTGLVDGAVTQPLTDIAMEIPAYGPDVDLDREKDFSATTWRVSLDYSVSENMMVFGSVSEGFRSGGFNGRAIANPAVLDVEFNPETLLSYEIGFKSDLQDGRFRLNGALFFTEYTDMQFSAILAGTPSVITDNAGESEITGFELNGFYYFSDNTRLDYSLGHMNPEFTKLSAGVQANGIDLNDPFAMTPSWTHSLGLRHEIAMENALLVLRGDYSRSSKYAFLPQANKFDFQKGFSLLNMTVTYAPNNGNWEFALFGNNILDEKYSYFKEDLRLTFFGHALDFPAPGREYGVRAKYNF